MTLDTISDVRMVKRYRAHLRRYVRCVACRFREQTDGTYHCQRRPERQGTCDTDSILPAFRFDEEVLEGCAMRHQDELTKQLRRLGHAQVNRFALSRADRSVHVLDKVRDYAPLTKERALQDLVARDGGKRRRFMAAHSGVQVPLWAVDPIRASKMPTIRMTTQGSRSTSGFRTTCAGWTGRWQMARQYPLRELIVRTEFTMSAS